VCARSFCACQSHLLQTCLQQCLCRCLHSDFSKHPRLLQRHHHHHGLRISCPQTQVFLFRTTVSIVWGLKKICSPMRLHTLGCSTLQFRHTHSTRLHSLHMVAGINAVQPWTYTQYMPQQLAELSHRFPVHLLAIKHATVGCGDSLTHEVCGRVANGPVDQDLQVHKDARVRAGVQRPMLLPQRMPRRGGSIPTK
jgi:hypothetical protein